LDSPELCATIKASPFIIPAMNHSILESLPSSVSAFIVGLSNDPNTIGIVLFGSWARGNSHPESDIDLIQIVSDGETRRSIESINGQFIEIVSTTEQGAKEFYQSHKDDCVDLWSYAHTVFDRDGAIERLKAFADSIRAEKKKALYEWQIRHMKYNCYDSLRAAERRADSDTASALLLVNHLVFSLTEYYFDLCRIWTPPPKQRMDVIRSTTPALAVAFEEAIHPRLGDTVTDVVQRARNVVDLVFKTTQ
jgi:predicted nucleotidyltransferase